MLEIEYKKDFLRKIKKIKDNSTKEKIKKQVEKIIENPYIGKPMRYNRKDTRELYFSSFRIAYSLKKKENKLMFVEIYHKDKQ